MNTNRKIIEDFYKAFIRGDLQHIIDACAEDAIWNYYGFPELPIIGEFQGKTGIKQFFETLRIKIKPLDFKCHEFIVDGDLVVVLGAAKVNVLSTEKTFEHNWCHVYTFKDGKITSLRGFSSNPYGMAIAFNAL